MHTREPSLLRLIYFGTGDFGLPTLRRLIASRHTLVAVVTQPDRPKGRGRKVRDGPIKRLAIDAGIPVFQPPKVNDPQVVHTLLSLDPELAVVVAFGQKIGRNLLDNIPAGFINVHASLLPKYRGAAPINWAVINGETQTGLTVFQLVEEMDAGPIWATASTGIGPTETAGELHDRLADMGPDLVLATIDRITDGRDQPIPQDHSQATLAPKLAKDAGRIDFARPAQQVARLICGLWPWPGGACTFHKADDSRSLRVLLARARAVSDAPATDTTALPGTIVADGRVAAGQGLIEILQLKPAGGKLMAMADFVNGYHAAPGDRFAPISAAEP